MLVTETKMFEMVLNDSVMLVAQTWSSKHSSCSLISAKHDHIVNFQDLKQQQKMNTKQRENKVERTILTT